MTSVNLDHLTPAVAKTFMVVPCPATFVL